MGERHHAASRLVRTCQPPEGSAFLRKGPRDRPCGQLRKGHPRRRGQPGPGTTRTQSPWRKPSQWPGSRVPATMKVFAAVLLALILCAEPGKGQEQDEDEDDGGLNGYDDDDDDDEANEIPGARDRAQLQCYSCQSLREGEACDQVRNCLLGQTFCKTFLSRGDTESGLLTTYSGWCADTCLAVTKTIAETRLTMACCQSALCNVPPWHSPQARNPLGSGAGGPKGSLSAVGTALLLGFLAALRALGS
ncbi:glycosylphosphatidylinositol-anchored high density lipoprotein-binding protein 1 [Tamandua tetradactyla]|uniref:glycosylphosphatidylinositol-anchored high density lipoprotein-binding protein 1 n=1 Tax=Tamandua tetradactyla TaxID=48850 RepID=UPI004053F484